MRHGLGACRRRRPRRGERRIARHDAPLLDWAGAVGARAGSFHGRDVGADHDAGPLDDYVDRICAEHARGSMGRVAVFPAGCPFAGDAAPEHVHLDRAWDGGRLYL